MNNPVLGNFVVLLNPISWAFYWTTVRHAEKLRAATLTKNNKSATTEPAEQWWEEMLAIQLITTLIEAGAGTVGMLCTGWDEQWNTIRSPDDLLTYAWFGGAYIPVVILLFSLAPRYIATAEMGSIKMLETVTTPFWMYLYDKEVPSVTALVGGGLIIVAVVTWSILTLRADPQQNRRTRTDGKVPAAEGALPKIQEATPPPHRP